MKLFIGIVPPEDIYNAVADIQKRFGDNRLEPHITLRPPATIKEEANWVKAVKDICSTFPPFPIQLPATGHFGKRVLFIDVSSDLLTKLHYSLLDAIKPFEQSELKKQENDYNPHLTLGRSWCGFTKEDFVSMKYLADEFLSTKKVSFMAHSVRIYHKPSPTARYEAKQDIALTGIA